MDPVEFLTARLDEDEAVARAAISGQGDEGWITHDPDASSSDERVVHPHVGIVHEHVQRVHIVRWDPWRVLADVEAKKQIAKIHVRRPAVVGATEPKGYRCRCCQTAYPCTTVRWLIQPFAAHSDYDESWRP